jgi:hypothetical protein
VEFFPWGQNSVISSAGMWVCMFGGVASVYIKQWFHLEEWDDGFFVSLGKHWLSFHLRLEFYLDGKPSTCIFLFCLFYVYESVMLSFSWLCQVPNAFSHVFQSNGHLSWAFHQRTKTFGHWVNWLKTWFSLQLHCPKQISVKLIDHLFEKWILCD